MKGTDLAQCICVLTFSCRCGHCQRLAPTWDDLARHFESREDIHISKVDCTQHSSTCHRHGVKGYPTLLVFEDGSLQDKYTGNRALQDLIEFINNIAPSEPEKVTSCSFSLDNFNTRCSFRKVLWN